MGADKMTEPRKRLYRIYNGMRSRCENKNRKDYPRYGAVGINVCEEWKGEKGFTNFYNWAIENGYQDNLTIDRIDGDLGYNPRNCRWATPSEQCRNKKNNHLIEYNGEVKTLKEWSEVAGLRKDTFRRRIIDYGWNMEDALTVPNLKGRTRCGHRNGR